MPKKQPTKPEIHRFKKVIVTEGKYRQYNPKTNQFEMREVTKDDLQKTASTFQEMRGAGLRVPAPWKHDFNVTTFAKLEEGDNGLLKDSSVNAGFWESLSTEVIDGKTALVGTIEAAGKPEDPNTPAGKIGTSVKDTSIYLRDKFVDGTGKEWDKAIMHIALVTHPIEPNQRNFELAENDSYIAMSELMENEIENGSETDALLSELSGKLRKVCKIFLPPNTTSENLVSNLMIAVSQYELCEGEENGSTPGSSESKFVVEPVIMANFNKDQIEALVAANAINPATNKAFTLEDFQNSASQVADPVSVQTQLVMSAMQSTMQADRRKAYRSRIDQLVETGRTTKAFADSNLYTQADSYNLEFANGEVKAPALETVLMSLEQLPPAKKEDGSEYVVMNGLDTSEQDDQFFNDVASEMLGLL